MSLNTNLWLDNSSGPGAPSITTDPPNPAGSYCLRLASQAGAFSTKFIQDGNQSYIYTDVLTGTYLSGTWTIKMNMSTDQGYTQNLNFFLWVTDSVGNFISQQGSASPVVVASAEANYTMTFTTSSNTVLNGQRLCININNGNYFYRIWMDNTVELQSPGVLSSGNWNLMQKRNELYNTMNTELR